MRHGLYLAPFGELSDPRIVAEIAVAAEESGWDGLFLWDHMLRPVEQATHIADPWVVLAAVATATSHLQIGPLVTPPVRRRIQKLIREVIGIDQLSNGRLILGLGLGVDSGGELTRFGELLDPIERGDLLDEAVTVLQAAWTGETVTFHGRYLTVDGVAFLPRAVREPHVPMWFAARTNAPNRPIRRAARHGQGIHLTASPSPAASRDDVARILDVVAAERGSLDGFDVALSIPPSTSTDIEGWGVTWAMHALDPTATAADVMAMLDRR